MTASEGGAVSCPCCGGAGLTKPAAGGTAGKSEAVLLRGAILRLYGVIGSLEERMASIHSVAGGTITDLSSRLKAAGVEIGARNRAISSVEREMAIRDSWNDHPQSPGSAGRAAINSGGGPRYARPKGSAGTLRGS